MSSSASRRARRADRKSMPLMPDTVRRSVEQIALKYGMTSASVLSAMCALYSKSLPGNRCVGCDETILESPAALYAINDSPKGVVGSVCPACADRYLSDDKFARRIDSEGYRAAHGAGPDDVGGTA